MSQYDRTDVPEGIEVNKTTGLCECIICHYWFFLEINVIFQPKVCDGFHDLIQKTMNFNDVAIASVKGNDDRIHVLYTSKDDPIILLGNHNLNKRSGTF